MACRVQTAETTSLADWLPTATLDLGWGTTVIAITPTGDEAFAVRCTGCCARD